MTDQKRHRLLLALSYLLVLGGTGIYLFSQVPHTDYRDDETGWVRNSIRIAQALLDFDLRPASWEFEEDTFYGSLNPHLGKFPYSAVAIGLRPHYGGNLPPIPKPYHFTRIPGDYEIKRNIREGRVAPPEVLYPMRRVTALWGLALIALCMAMVHLTVSPLAGILTGLLLALNEPLTRTSTQVMTDAQYNFFTALTALLAVWVVVAATRSQGLRRFAVLALSVALATATKLAGWMLLLPLAAWSVGLLWKRGLIGWRMAAALLPAMLALVVIVNFALNPYLWPDLSKVSTAGLKKDWRLLKHGEYTVGVEGPPTWLWRFQKEVPPPGLHRLPADKLQQLRTGLWEKSIGKQVFSGPAEHPIRVIPALYELTRPVQFPLLYVRWSTLKKYIYDTKRRSSNDVFLRNITFLGQSIPGEFLFALAGLAAVGHRAWRTTSPRRRLQLLTLLAYAAAITGVIFLTRLNDSDRYVLPILIIRAMFASVGIAWLLRFLARRLSKQRGGEAHEPT